MFQQQIITVIIEQKKKEENLDFCQHLRATMNQEMKNYTIGSFRNQILGAMRVGL